MMCFAYLSWAVVYQQMVPQESQHFDPLSRKLCRPPTSYEVTKPVVYTVYLAHDGTNEWDILISSFQRKEVMIRPESDLGL